MSDAVQHVSPQIDPAKTQKLFTGAGPGSQSYSAYPELNNLIDQLHVEEEVQKDTTVNKNRRQVNNEGSCPSASPRYTSIEEAREVYHQNCSAYFKSAKDLITTSQSPKKRGMHASPKDAIHLCLPFR